MSDFFNIRRFASYAAKTYRENARMYLTYMLGILGIQALVVIICAVCKLPVSSLPQNLDFLIIPTLGVLFVFSEMRPMRNRHMAPITLTQPVSIFERYILLLFNTTILFVVVYALIYVLVSFVSSEVFHFGEFRDYWGKFARDRRGWIPLGYIFAILSRGLLVFNALAIFAGGTSVKNHLAAFTIVTIVGLLLLGSPVYLPWLINVDFLENVELSTYFNGIMTVVKSGSATVQYTTVPMFGEFFSRFGGKGFEIGIWTLLLWVTGYFKLKERQVK